jgi:hypothetical protein
VGLRIGRSAALRRRMPHRSHRHDDERAAKEDRDRGDASDTRCDEECHEAPFGPDGPAMPPSASHLSTRATSQTPVLPRPVRHILPETPGRSFNQAMPAPFSLVVRRSPFSVRGSPCAARRAPVSVLRSAFCVLRSSSSGTLHLHRFGTRRRRHGGFIASHLADDCGPWGQLFGWVLQIRHECVVADAEEP